MEAREHLSFLVHMALGNTHELIKRKGYLYHIGLSKGLKKCLIDYLIEYPDPFPDILQLTDYEQFECLYTAIQFMKYGRKVRKSEARFCQRLALRLGYLPQIVYELSAFIYNDPTLSVNKNFLHKLALIYTPKQEK